MKRFSLILILFISAGIFILGRAVKELPSYDELSEDTCIAKHIIDGDTIVVHYKGRDEKVRLIGINTPEIHHPAKGVEPFGYEAKKFVEGVLKAGDRIKLEFDIQSRDKYGRLLAYVYLSDGRFLNALLVENGYAQVMTIPPNLKYQDLFLDLERKAREEDKGLWGCRENECGVMQKGYISNGKNSECNFVASKMSSVFHKPGCEWARKIKEWNRQCFKKREDAIKSGKRACRVCRP